MSRYYRICIFVLLLATSSLAFEPDTLLIYKTVDSMQLALHTFYPADYASRDDCPAIVFFFGGGWKRGSPEQFYPHCDYFASRGLVAMSAAYRIENSHGTTPAECVMDAKSAIRWIRRHASELKINPDQVAAGGGSAGGHLAAAAGTISGFNQAGEDTCISCRPDALLLFNPVFDNGPEGYGYERVKSYWQDFSPIVHINKNTPATIVFLGAEDQLVPVKTAERFVNLLHDQGKLCDLRLYPGQKHGFFNYANTKYFKATVSAADSFLVALGMLKRPLQISVPADPNDR